MKIFHLPTLLYHGALTLFAALTINHYHDAFLPIAGFALLIHAAWYAESKHNMLPAHLLGCAAQFALYQLGIISVHSLGGEFAIFFYAIAMAVSCLIELVIFLVKLVKK